MHFHVVDVMLVTSISAYMGEVYAVDRVTGPEIDHESGLLVKSTDVKHAIKTIKQQHNNCHRLHRSRDDEQIEKLTETVMKSTTQDMSLSANHE